MQEGLSPAAGRHPLRRGELDDVVARAHVELVEAFRHRIGERRRLVGDARSQGLELAAVRHENILRQRAAASEITMKTMPATRSAPKKATVPTMNGSPSRRRPRNESSTVRTEGTFARGW